MPREITIEIDATSAGVSIDPGEVRTITLLRDGTGEGEGEGGSGWSPILATVTDGERRVLQVTSWTGGTGSPPASGSYIGPVGLVPDIADAVDIRGAQGATGADGAAGADGAPGADGADGAAGADGADGADGDTGWSPVLAAVSDGERRVLQVSSWTGGTGTPPASGGYIGVAGLVVDIADAVDVRGATGATGAQGDPGADGADGAAGAPGPSNQIDETSGPTSLMVGAIADGQYLRRSGSSVVGAGALEGSPLSVVSGDLVSSAAIKGAGSIYPHSAQAGYYLFVHPAGGYMDLCANGVYRFGWAGSPSSNSFGINQQIIQFGRNAGAATLRQEQKSHDAATFALSVHPQNAFSTAATHLTGGDLALYAGAGASASAGAAHGGHVYLDGGRGYGTGGDGEVRVGQTRGRLHVYGAALFDQPPQCPACTVATAPDPALYPGGWVVVVDEVGGEVPAWSDGTDWRRSTDRAVIS